MPFKLARAHSRPSLNVLIIREARVNEGPLLAKAEQKIAAAPGRLVSKPRELKAPSFTQKIEDLNIRKKGKYLVAEVDGKVAGHANLDPLFLSARSHVFQLTIAVHQGSQGQGLGNALMRALVDWAKKDRRVEKIELLVRASNKRAIKLYKKFRFREEGRFKKRIKVAPGRYLDDVAMALWVK